MKKELKDIIINKNPDFFSLMTKDFKVPISFGIGCGDGWFFILDSLIDSISFHLDNNSKFKREDFKITQIKEKFGFLCFYHDRCDDEKIKGMISLALNMSLKTCEECGDIKDIKQQKINSWIYTNCDICIDKRKTYIEKNR